VGSDVGSPVGSDVGSDVGSPEGTVMINLVLMVGSDDVGSPVGVDAYETMRFANNALKIKSMHRHPWILNMLYLIEQQFDGGYVEVNSLL
jgi:hypothetical protein